MNLEKTNVLGSPNSCVLGAIPSTRETQRVARARLKSLQNHCHRVSYNLIRRPTNCSGQLAMCPVFHRIILFPSKEKNKSVVGRTVIHPLPLYVRKPRPPELPSLSRETVSEGVESGSGTGLTRKLVWGAPLQIFNIPAVTQDGQQAGPRGSW